MELQIASSLPKLIEHTEEPHVAAHGAARGYAAG
jgi:hypothetical protein